MHKNAKLTWAGRVLLVERVRTEGWTVGEVGVAMGVSERTVRKWIARYEAEGEVGLRDRSMPLRRASGSVTGVETR